MTPWIKFRGIDSRDMGVIMERLPDEPRARRNFEEIPIPGRDGRSGKDKGSYDIAQTNMSINLNGREPTDIYAWLQGEGWLITSDDPEKMRWVSLYDQISDAGFRVQGACYDTITVPVRMQPYKYSANAESEYADYTSAAVFNGQGNAKALPILEITGSGDITLMANGATVMIDELDGTIIIDCDAMTAYTEANGVISFAGRKVAIVDEWPRLDPDSNSVNWTGNVSRLRIRPWWRWL